MVDYFQFGVLVFSGFMFNVLCTNSTNKRTIEEEYYYDYELAGTDSNTNPNPNGTNTGADTMAVNTDDLTGGNTDSLILPNPELVRAQFTVDILPHHRHLDLSPQQSSHSQASSISTEEEEEDNTSSTGSIVDNDLHDHDFIDNLMYVYYGSSASSKAHHQRNYYGPEIVIVGSVLSCAAQLLTIFMILLRRKSVKSGGMMMPGMVGGNKRDTNASCLFLHTVMCLSMANLLFMLGVHATKNSMKCQIIAIFLHYLHLLTATWVFVYGYYIYKRFCSSEMMKDTLLIALTYSLPAFFTLLSFITSPSSYETRKFCFVSVQKGMLFHYMLPVSCLIIATTAFALNGIRRINLELAKLELTSSAESLNALKHELEQQLQQQQLQQQQELPYDCRQLQQQQQQQQNGCYGNGVDTVQDMEIVSLREGKRCLKALCALQTSYDIVWFVAVLALENVQNSNSMSVVYAVTSCLLNWYIFARTKSFLPSIAARFTLLDQNRLTIEHEKKALASKMALVSCNNTGSSDSIPLLISSGNGSVASLSNGIQGTETEMHDIVRPEYICTISS